MTLTVGSLFAGIGGFDLGLERTGGFKTAWQVEIDEYATRVLEKHWPDVRRWGDVRTFPPPAWVLCPDGDNFICSWHGGHAHDCECPDLETWDSEWRLNPYEQAHPGWKCDIITSGDPCLENSAARVGNRTTQPSLGGEFVRVVAAIRPRLVLRENPAKVRKDAPWPWWRVRSELESLGYACVPFRLRACCVGADHQRERLFLFGEDANSFCHGLERREDGAKGRRKPIVPARLVQAENGIDLSAPRGMRSRAGFPDYVDRVRCVGNAVVPQVAQWIGERILEAESNGVR